MKLKNVDNSLEKMDDALFKSLCFLDNHNVYISIVFVLFLYNTCIFKNINHYISDLYNYNVVKVLVLLLIIYTSRKSYLISILLAISFVVSLNFKTIMENFVTDPLPNSNDNYAPVPQSSDSNSTIEQNTINETNFNSEPKNNQQEETHESFQTENNNVLTKEDCNNNYRNTHESVGDLCTPTTTFNDEYNTQGLNSIIGYDNQVGYQL
tara:strand:+ start:4446 stop:5072 length:627 start_codon:yes stop_codon:yes gene_type:complete